jgi:sugar phosphate isomerase/epimerase
LHAIGSSACFHSPDIQERERNLDSALRMAEVAAGLGAPAIRVFGDRIQPGSKRKETVTWIADSLTQLADKLRPMEFKSGWKRMEILRQPQM